MIASIKRNSKPFKEILGIIGICLLLYFISNYGNYLLFSVFDLTSPTVLVMFLNRILLWIALLLFFLYVKLYLKEQFLPWEERHLSIFKTILSIIIVLGLLFAGFVGLVLIIQSLNFSTQSDTNQGIELLYRSIPLMIFTCFTAAVLEELLFRGYILPTIVKIINSVWGGIFLSSILFGLMHLSYGTSHQVIIPIYFGVVFSTFYVKFQSLKITIFCHFIWNLVVYLDSAELL